MRTPKKLFVVLPLAFMLLAFYQDTTLDDILAPGAKLEKLAGGFEFTEGPTVDKRGNVYFTDQPNDRIMVWSTAGKLSTFMQPCGRSNGMAFDKEGNLWSCADEKNELWCIKPGKNVIVVLEKYGDKPFNGPNDVWFRDNDGLYFTDPYFKRTWWTHTDIPQAIHGVYYLSPDRKTLTRVAEDLKQPNGIVGTTDGKTLYVSDIAGNKTWSYTINENGSLTNKTLFCEKGSDGMTIDSKGNLYLTGNGVTVFDKSGKQIGFIKVPESWTANVCFGDPDLKSLFITASKGLYRIRLKVKGTRF
jgi:gluconolactonase